MDTANLQKHIQILATVPESDEPFVSCYVAIENHQLRVPALFEEQVRQVRAGLKGESREQLDQALRPIKAFLADPLSSDARGVAFFSRTGKKPFFMMLRFRVPLPNWIAVDRAPNIYHLVELKDTYDQYAVMLVTKTRVRIFEINIGAAKEYTCAELPDPGDATARRYAKEHYQKHMKDREHRFIKENIRVLEQLVLSKENMRLILAGHPTMTARVREELPKSLLSRLADVVRASDSDVVQATIDAFIKAEERESQAIAEKLAQQVHSGGLAVVGTAASFDALKQNQADTLVLLQSYAPGRMRICRACDFMEPETGQVSTRPKCGSKDCVSLDVKEEMVRLAEQHLCAVEIVNESEFLSHTGGVGCLLRYRLAREYGRESLIVARRNE